MFTCSWCVVSVLRHSRPWCALKADVSSNFFKRYYYNGFVQNLVSMTQMHQGLCMFNYVIRCRFAVVSTKMFSGITFFWDTVYRMRAKYTLHDGEVFVGPPYIESNSRHRSDDWRAMRLSVLITCRSHRPHTHAVAAHVTCKVNDARSRHMLDHDVTIGCMRVRRDQHSVAIRPYVTL